MSLSSQGRRKPAGSKTNPRSAIVHGLAAVGGLLVSSIVILHVPDLLDDTLYFLGCRFLTRIHCIHLLIITETEDIVLNDGKDD